METLDSKKADFAEELGRLTPKQRAFILEYVELGHATKAAIRAGYSLQTAYSIGSENLAKPQIRSLVDRMIATEIEQRPRVLVQLSGQMPRVHQGAILRLQGTVVSRTDLQNVLDNGSIIATGQMKTV